MKFTQFTIKNYKGIEDITFDLDKSPAANIYTLIGLNESGKTTILEAINSFNFDDKGMSALELPGLIIKDYDDLIPISKRDNFNGTISLIVTIKLESDDMVKINKLASEKTNFKSLQKKDKLIYYKYYHYENSTFKNSEALWSGFSGIPNDSTDGKYIFISDIIHKDDNMALATLCRSLIPNILYFPNFLFDFPSKIYLETSETEPSSKYKFYLELIQDILNSLENETNVKNHLVERIKSNSSSQRRNLDRLIQLMGIKVTEVVFNAWGRIFKRNMIQEQELLLLYNLLDMKKTFHF